MDKSLEGHVGPHDGPFLFVLSGSNIREISLHIAGDRDIFDIDEGRSDSIQARWGHVGRYNRIRRQEWKG